MKKHNRHNTTISKSVRIKLEEQGLVNNQLLTLISSISLEDLIALKLEPIVQESVLKFAISTRKSKKDAARFLGLNYLDFKKLLSKYHVEEYFDI